MLSCKEVVRAVSSDQELSFMRRLELKLHFMMCKHCSRYLRQIKILKKSVREYAGTSAEKSAPYVAEIEKKVLDQVEMESRG